MQKVVLALCLIVGLCVTAFAQSEVLCNDGVDNDGDGKIDCNDTDCQFVATIEKGCRCYDNIDNDGDGKIDKADGDCATYYGLTFVGQGSNCSITPPGAATPFTGMSPPIVSGQNTADTQSKVAVGDVDGDGYPDAVITSKWNSEVRVVSTGNFSGYASGDIKGDFKTTGQGAAIFPSGGKDDPCDPKNLLFEHEVVIADIDHKKASDGKYKAEIFTVISNRLGNPESPPDCYFLLGFSYPVGGGTLVPLPGYPVRIGTDRPGILGVADFDADGKAEIYLKNRIYAAENGTLLADGGGNWDSEINSGPVAANITGDSKLELIVGNLIYSVPTLTSRTLQSMTLFADMNATAATKYYPRVYDDVVEYGLDNHSSSSVADIDEDGTIDVLMTGSTVKYPAAQNTTIFYWNVKKNMVSTYAPPDPTYPSGWPWGTGRINIGDSDGDGDNEATFMAGNQLFNLEFDPATSRQTLMSSAKWTRTVNDSRSGVLSVTIYDFNNDANPELVYRDSQELVVVDGKTGANKQWSAVCQSHTYTEGPIIADVNGDGGTDICVPCYRNANAFSINGGLQQQALGEVRLFFSSTNSWLPTRRVWNQPGYFVVNINDDLTLPRPQLDQNLVFGTAPCPNGLPGPQMPLNIYLNQVPHLSASGCPVFPAPDLTYVGDTPNPTSTDTDGDGVYTPAVVVTPPICGDLGIQVYFNIINNGDLPISDNVPVSFFNGDPTVSPVTATKLFSSTIAINNLQVGQKLVTPTLSFNGPGSAFKLYIVLYNDGSILPINLAGQSTKECTINNNMYSVDVAPDPFTVTVEKLTDNQKCSASAADTGSIRAHVFKGGVEVLDYSPFAFQWYTGAGTTSPIAAPTGTAYNLLGRAAGDYTVVVTNTQKGCKGIPVTGTIADATIDPTINITVLSNQTQCSPANGKLQADIVGGNVGYTFDWYDISLVPLGISGPTASNLVAGNYVVLVGKSGCTKTSAPATVLGPQVPDATASVLQNVVDCADPNSGQITANAVFNGVVQPPANYTFNWYFYDNPTSTRGSILPLANGTGQTRTGLKVGYYQVEIKDNATQCISQQSPVVQVTSQTVIPDPPKITQLAAQTSCDPTKPNGILTADVFIGGVAQNPAGFTFEWFKGQNTLAANLVTTVSDVNGKTVNQVVGGGTPYTVKVTTPNHCFSTSDFTIGENIINPVVTLAQLTPNSVCDPAKTNPAVLYNGSLKATVTFNSVAVTLPDPNYQFTWRDASNVVIPVGDNTNPVLGSLKEGNYFVSVERMDLFCNSTPDAEPVLKATILPQIKTDSIPSTSCNASFKNGKVMVKTVDGLLPSATTIYSYQWQDNSNVNIPGATSDQLSNLQGALNYTIHVLNKTSGCENTHTIPLPDAHVIPAVSLVVVSPNSICTPPPAGVLYNGKIQANFTQTSGNAADYQYEWRNVTSGNVIIGTTPPVQAGLTANQFGGLNGNITYSVIAKNTVLGCNSAPAQVLLPNAPLLPVIKMDSVASTNCDPTKPNGSVSVKTVDGLVPSATPNYSYLWTDSGATPSVSGQSTGSQVVNVNGGFNYTVEVTNKLTGCKNTHVTPLPDIQKSPTVQLVVVQPNSICDPAKGYNGIIQSNFLTTVGNAADYQYTWNNVTTPGAPVTTPPAQAGLTVNQLGGLQGAMTYSVKAMNTVLGCFGVSQVLLPNAQQLPVIKMDSVASTNCIPSKANGKVIVNTVDGLAPSATTNYGYLWTDNGSTAGVAGQTTGSQVVNVQGGFNYTIEITNNTTGCKNTHTTPLPDKHVIPGLQAVVVQPNSVCDITKGYNGEIQANLVAPLVGNAADYQYTWNNVTTPGAPVVTPPAQGGLLVNQLGGLNGNITYSVAATNTILGCTSVIQQILLPNALLLPVIKMDSVASTNCIPSKANGQVIVNTVDGVAPSATTNYTYLWSDNGSTAGVTGQTTGSQVVNVQGGFNYTVEITNKTTGCQNTHTTPLPDKHIVPVMSLAVTSPNGVCDKNNATSAFTGQVQATFTTNSGNLADYQYTWRDVTNNTPKGTTPPIQVGPTVFDFGGLDGNIKYGVTAFNTLLGCTSAEAVVVVPNQFLLPVIKTDSIPSTNCDPALSNGQVSVTTIDGAAPTANYSIAWSDVASTPSTPTPIGGNTAASVGSLQGGFEYKVAIVNKTTGCANTHIIPLTEDKPVPTISLAKIKDNVNCDAVAFGSSGQIDATVKYRTITQNPIIGSSLPSNYVITWSIAGNTDSQTGLPAGTYTAYVTDTNLGCVSGTDSETILDSFDHPAIAPLTEVDQTSCTNVPNGELHATISGGPVGSTFRYEWFQGVGVTGTSLGTASAQPNLVVADLVGRASDDYSIWVRNEKTGCETVKSSFIANHLTYPSVSLTNSHQVTFCAPASLDGAAQATLTGLTGPANGKNYDLFYVYTFQGGTYPTDAATIKASVDPNNSIGGSADVPAVYDKMAPGYLSALVIDNNTGCESNPTNVQIIDATSANQITVNGVTRAGFCGGVGGAIDVTIAGGSGAQTFDWYEGTPSNNNINFFNNPPDMSGATSHPQSGTVDGTSEDLGPPTIAVGVGAGTYTLVIVDSKGCGAYFVENVPFTGPPVFTVSKLDVTTCTSPYDGRIDVDITSGPSLFGYTIEIFEGNGPGTPVIPMTATALAPTSAFADQLKKGQYFIRITDQKPTNQACPLGQSITLDQVVYDPVVTLGTIQPNTSCDPDNFGSGSVIVHASVDANQTLAADFWVSKIVSNTPSTPGPVGFVKTDVPEGADSAPIGGFGNAGYTITVVDTLSHCRTNVVANIPDQPVLPQIFTVDALDDSYCAPTSNGKIEVTAITGAINEYNYEWYTSSDVTNPANLVYSDNGGGGTTGEVFNGTKAGWSFGATAGLGNGDRTYFVRGKRIAGTGIGCYTALEQRTVLDAHKTPNLTLTPFANTSCIPGTREGVIRASTDIAADPLDANVRGTGTYTYSWVPDPALASPAGGIARVTNYDITQLDENGGAAYTVTSKNSVNGCIVSGTAVIPTQKIPISVISYSTLDQLICLPDGEARVTEVKIDALNTAAATVYTFNTALALQNNFDFQWFDANTDGDNDASTFDATSPLEASPGVDVTDVVLTDDATQTLPGQAFPTMKAGTYYVMAKRKPGLSPGAGCFTSPTRITIEDKHIDPEVVSIAGYSNTSCNPAVTEGRIEIKVKTNSGVPAESGSTYAFTWTPASNPGGQVTKTGVANNTATTTGYTIPPTFPAPPTQPAPGDALGADDYTVLVKNEYSGCTTTATSTITSDKFPITLVSYTSANQLICTPDGRITVTDVKIDATSSNLGVFDYNTAALINTNFNLSWFQASSTTPPFDPSNPLKDGTNTIISGEQISNANFPTMGEGTYYVVATRDPGMSPGAGCTTAPTRVDLIKQVNMPQVTSIEAFANTSCDSNVTEGRIELAVNTNSGVVGESGSTYSYTWTPGDLVGNAAGQGFDNAVANGTATGGYTIPPTYSPPPPTAASLADALKDDTYTITVKNDYSGCTTTTTAKVDKTKYPLTLVSYTSQNQLICLPDGDITVTKISIDGSASGLPVINYGPGAGITAEFDLSWFKAAAATPGTFDPLNPLKDASNVKITAEDLSTANFPTMGEGTYYVVATRKPGMSPGAGCSTAPTRVDLIKQINAPQVVSLQGFANTSCDSGVTEGRIEIKVNTNSGVVAESGSTYSFVTTPASNPPGQLVDNNISNATAAGTGFTIPNGYQQPPLAGPALKDDTYTIDIKNDYSGCTTTTQAILPKAKYPLTLVSFTSQNQLVCMPDGNITVTQVTIDGSTSNLPVYNYNTQAALAANFDLSWFQSGADPNTFDPASPLKDGSNNKITAVQLSNANFPTMGEGTYYVVATRKPGMSPGAGCQTAPARVNILKQVNNPVITSLKAFNNTSCESTTREGRIELAVNTTSTVGAESGSTYSYQWAASDPANTFTDASGSQPNLASSTLTIPQNFPANGLRDDTYTITVQNDYSKCSTTQQAIVSSSKLPITLISYITEDQLICNPDGKITVTNVSIDATASGQGVFTFSPNSAPFLGANFDLKWFKATSPTNPTVFDPNAPLLDATNAVITNYVLSASGPGQTYPAMGAGTYYVSGTRKSGLSPGAGCTTTPVRVDIQDLSTNPEISFASRANSACNPAKANGSVTGNAKELDGSIGTYTYAWQFNSAPNPTVTNTITNALDGNYELTVQNTSTGCKFTSDFKLILDPTMSSPNVIDVSTVDPIDCLPSASAQVTKISLGSTSNSTLFPPNVPPNNTITGAALANFGYDWYQGAYDPASLMAGQNAPLLSNIKPGTYFVAVQDPSTDCKSGPKEVLIKDDKVIYPVARILQTIKQISCTATGTAALASFGDNQDDTDPNYTFDWYHSLDVSGPRFATTSAISSLTVGDYSVNITNLTTGCSTPALYTIPDEAPLFKPEVSSGGYPRTLCIGQDGTVTARVTNLSGAYPFPYNFTSDLYIGGTPDLTKAPDFPSMAAVPGFVANYQQTALAEGTYTIRVTDNNTGCIGVTQADVLDDRELPKVVIVQDNPLTNCDPKRANGQLSATADNGQVGGYSFAWYSGTAVPTPAGSPLTMSDKLIAQGAGSYVVRVVNNLTGCQSDLSGSVTDATVKPPVPDPKVVFDRTNCITPNGWVNVSVGGVVFNYTFNWYDGSATKASSDFVGVDYENRDIGPYTVTATDDVTGCVSPPGTVTVADKRVIPQFDISSTPSYCSDTGKPKGAGSISFELTTPDVVLDNAVWTNVETGGIAGTGPAVYDLFPGDYHVVVTSTEGCVNEGQGLVATEIAPYNGISENGDGQNDFFIIDCITNFPFNNVKIFNRSGVLVYEANGYNNNDVSFKGVGEKGVYLQGIKLPSGTYFYIIDKRDGSKPVAGFLELDR